MKPSFILSSVLFAGSLLPLSAQEGKIEAVEPVDGDPDKPQILPYDEADDAADDEDIEETDEEDPVVWFPGDLEFPDVIPLVAEAQTAVVI